MRRPKASMMAVFVTGTIVVAGAFLGWLAASVQSTAVQAEETRSAGTEPKPPADFKGVIKLDIRDSKADWAPFTPKAAPKGAPNILFILYDDTGLAAWSPYGGRINMPTMDRLAKNGTCRTGHHAWRHSIRVRLSMNRSNRNP